MGNRSGETCLHYAVSSQQKEIVKLLVDHSANPTIKNSQLYFFLLSIIIYKN